jgi:delta1-piperideine-2-carboxylate reductase
MPLIDVAALTEMVREVFLHNRVSAENAKILAETCVFAERDGAESHGLFRLPGYIASLKSGWVDGFAQACVDAPGGGSIVKVDARNGFAQPALRRAFARTVALSHQHGICLLAIRDSHHFGPLWLDIEPFVDQGLVALAFVNSSTRVVPWGGHEPVYGTNPMAFGVPRRDAWPMIFDQSSSAVAFGDVKLAALAGRKLPEGAGVDRHGNPTTDAAAVVDGGGLLPFGGHKGSSIALMVELLCAALNGGSFSFEVDHSSYAGAQTPRTGETLIVIDPAKTTHRDFTARTDELFSRLRQAGQERLPADRRYARRRRAEQSGIEVSDGMIRLIAELSCAPIESLSTKRGNL